MADLELVVLGSGGPFVTARRTSASYVVLLGGRPLLLLDAGAAPSRDSVRLGSTRPN